MAWGRGRDAMGDDPDSIDPKRRRVRVYAGGEPVEITMTGRTASVWSEISQNITHGYITQHKLADGRSAVINWKQVVALTVEGLRGEEPPERLA